MADAKITALTANTTPLSTDVTVMVDDPGGTPLTQKITLGNLMGLQTMTLLKANSGTSTNGSAENVDTVAISGLTANDTLQIYVSLESATAATATPKIYNSTDAVVIKQLSNLNADTGVMNMFFVRQSQSANTTIRASALSNASTGTITFTTAWTGSWTLALRHDGVSATGTLGWSWTVYKVAGQ